MRALELAQTSVLVLVSALLAAPAGAQQSIAPPPTPPAAPRPDADGLIWETPPPIGDLTSFRISDYRMIVEVRCRVASGSLVDCAQVVDTPQTFLEAAIRAASAARLAPLDQAGQATEGREIVVRITFPIPVSVEPPPAPPTFNALTRIVWIEQPTAEDFARVYPPDAEQQRIGGRVVLECLIGADGRPSCTVISEEPAGLGFGEAAIRLSLRFRAASETRDGAPTAGRRTRIPINFRVL